MNKYRTKLLFALISVIVCVLIGLGLLLGQLFKNYYVNAFNERVKSEMNIISTYIMGDGGLGQFQEHDIAQVGELLNARITIVDLSGAFVYDSGELHGRQISRHREIIEEVIHERPARPDMLEVGGGYDVHYFWKPLEQNGEIEGYIFLTTKFNELQKAYRQIWWLLTISLGIALLVIILMSLRITARYTKPIESAANVAIELAKGNFKARTYEEKEDETGMLSASINILARNLQDMVKSQEVQQDRLSTLIENMGSGLILIDSRGYINLINRAYKDIFHVGSSDYLDKLYHEVIIHNEVVSIIEKIFMTEQKVRKQIILPIGIERRHFEVYGVPIIGTNKVWKGVLLVFHDITELKKLEQIRQDFVANVSHELKTPITSIKGFSETLLDGAMEDEASLEAFLSIILKESNRLQALIEELLDLSKMEQQGFRLTIHMLDINQELREILPILQGKAERKKIELKLEASDDSLLIEGDSDRLKQVFLNLISNAIAYTPEGGKVMVSVINETDTVTVQVKDTGIGIEQDELPRIFERFYRVDKARSRNSGGTGLGLAIVKHIVEAHKGTIEVSSEKDNGTTFSVKLNKVH
ncbi:two-component system histidine kinase PnpS [Mesobacillus harenae]|uniref:two-component system histidine kinase PnpS n=1 Tax=Mesobacillus harenae TaxID=2213203 RepID=UPI0015805E30|nr:ATP-binding protein [Mesobacillus harenae]